MYLIALLKRLLNRDHHLAEIFFIFKSSEKRILTNMTTPQRKTQNRTPGVIYNVGSPSLDHHYYIVIFKRLAYTLTAYCYGSFICDATGCFVKAQPLGQIIVLDKSYTKQLGQNSILEHCQRDHCLARFSQFKGNRKQKQ